VKTENIPLKINHPGEKLSDHYRYLLARYLKPLWPQVVLLSVLLLGNIGLQLINPQIMRHFIDTIAEGIAVGGGGNSDLLFIGLLFLGIAILQQIFGVCAAYVSTNVSWLATNRLRFDVAQHCLHLDMSFHNKHTPGEMITRIDNDTGALSRFFSQFVVRMVSQSLFLIGVLFVLFLEDWRVGAILTTFSLIALFIIWRLKNISVPHWRAWSQTAAKLYGFLEERLNGVDDIRTAGAKSYVLNGFYKLMRAFMKIGLKASLVNNITMNTTMVLFAVANAIAFIVGAWLYLNNTITIGAVYIIFHYSAMLADPIQSLSLETQNLQSAGGSVQRIAELLKTENKLSIYSPNGNVPKKMPVSIGPPSVVFRNVCFRYDSGEDTETGPSLAANSKEPMNKEANGNDKADVLNDISFQLLPGRSLGLLGRTGSGKTTLARLLFRLYDPDSGTISIGRNGNLTTISQLPLSELRRQIGLVTQNVELFNASVYDNLTFFDDTVPQTKILEVLQKLGLWDWYQSLPQGLDTKISSGGKELSAGQAQLLAFARIFLQDPGIVILDEASSRLDPATEKLIEQAVKWLIQDRTTIIIAHRLNTIQNVDEIMIMEGGHIEEHGERESLVNDSNSRFSRLLQTDLRNSMILSD
jgi:ATP-binding cassette, subfamily B, bacterial